MTAPRLYLDANVFIAAYESATARSDHAWWTLDAIESGEFVGVTSELTLAEILVKPLADGDDDLVRRYKDIVTSSDELIVVAVDRDILVDAAELRSHRTSLRLPDAIHVASARRAGCTHIVSDDRRLPFAAGIAVVRLGPHTIGIVRGESP
ncbi:type II toxin-antitoxin system VapC family toxin [Rhodoplanes sp. SY1]|uniref:type II toxin-antitoxin system VapC family toxin n=1 Tax=Rhodoplanes sp. SY1 TaxID=3166646 RepID=UPI0038B4B3DF